MKDYNRTPAEQREYDELNSLAPRNFPGRASFNSNNGNNYIASYYIKGQFTEETINAQSEFHAMRIIEGRYAGQKDSWGRPLFKWSRTPQRA